MSSEEKKVNSSVYWYIVLPICVLIVLGFFVYVLFSLSSVQLIGTERVHALLKKMPHISR